MKSHPCNLPRERRNGTPGKVGPLGYGRSRVQLEALRSWDSFTLVPLSEQLGRIQASQLVQRIGAPTCSWTQPPTQRHLSVVEYLAYDMFVLASKHQAVFCSLPSLLPLQKMGQMVLGPLPLWDTRD